MAEAHPSLDLPRRMRRLRESDPTRGLVRETRWTPAQLIQPVFVIEAGGEPEAIGALPGQFRWPLDRLPELARRMQAAGLPAVALFPKLPDALKSPSGDEALNPDTLVLRAVRALKEAAPALRVITDLALDPYTTHGHDGLVDAATGEILNDPTVARLATMAVLHAAAGADWVAPSDMMDGRVGAIRKALDDAGHTSTAILAYAAKFNSGFYGPFREAVGSAPAPGQTALDKGTYQLDPANRRMAVQEALLDEAEGADLLMVKPAGPYLDILRELREATRLPLAAYQVSGEYAQLHAAAAQGWLDLPRCRDESLLAIFRAGADVVLTYFALEIAQERMGLKPGN